jgi:hypothetical protein
MSPAVRASVIAFFVFTAYFIVGSLISGSMRFPYGYVSAGALVLFFIAGFYIVRHYHIRAAALATGIAAFFSSLASWLILARLNPEPRPQTDAIGEVVVLMTVAALVAGFFGALVARRRSPAVERS